MAKIEVTCEKCGALIEHAYWDNHNEFHEKIDELIDWAQSVSKNFEIANKIVAEGGKNDTPSPEL